MGEQPRQGYRDDRMRMWTWKTTCFRLMDRTESERKMREGSNHEGFKLVYVKYWKR